MLREAARQRLFDTLLAALVGRRLPENAPLARPSGDGHGRLRALVATVRATEVDDIAISGCVTAGSVVAPTALHLAAAAQADAASVHDAMLAGYEAMIGFATAIGGATAIYRGVWPTLAAAPIGAAAVAARLAGLDAERTRAALALAIGRSSWWTDRSLPRWLTLGHAAVDGVLAAAAMAGFDAAPEVIDAWAAAARLTLDAEALAARPTPRLLEVDTKPFPTARQALSTIEAFAALHAAQPIGATDAIVVGVPGAYRAMIGGVSTPKTRMESLVSAACQMALVACAPDQIYDAVRARPPCGGAVAGFLSRVTVETDEAVDAAFPDAWGGRVTIRPARGAPREALVLHPRGSAPSPFGWPELEDKAARIARANGLDPAAVAALRVAVREDASPAVLLDLVN